MQALQARYPTAGSAALKVVAGAVCAECRFAQVYAVQDKARCHHPGSPHHACVVPASSTPCEEFAHDTRGLDLCSYHHAGKLLAP